MQILSTLAMNTLLADRMRTVEAQIQDLERQVASGVRVETYADLGAQAPIDIALHNEARTLETYKTNNGILAGRMEAMGVAMDTIHETVQTIQNKALASSGSETERRALVYGAAGALATVVNALQVSVDGRALFAGVGRDGESHIVQPMVASSQLLDSGGTLVTSINSALAAAPADKAGAVTGALQSFFATPSNFYTGGSAIAPAAIDKSISVDYGITGADGAFQKILEGLATIALAPAPNYDDAAVSATELSRQDYAAIVQSATGTITQGLDALRNLISANGSRQALVDSTTSQHEATLTMVRTQINDIEQTDMTSAATKLSLLSAQLQASYMLTSQIGQLSLLNYLD